jgi:hypothetical protein
MGAISNNISQLASVRTVTNLNYINKTYNIPQKNIADYQKQITEQDKNEVVNRQQNKYPNPASFNYQYQQSVPLSLLSAAGQPNNETAKALSTNNNSFITDESDNSDYTVEEINDKSQNINLGYYIIDKNMGAASGGNSTRKLSNPMKDRLNKTYNLNSGIEPGTFVNVFCY